MKQLTFVLACCLALTAQQTKDKIEYCGNGSSHDCHCVRHTHAVQDAYSESCRLNSKTDKEMQDCMSRVPSHCSLVDRYSGEEDGADQEATMSDRCTMMCKKHDCLCDDGPRCHIAHDASEHEQSGKK